MKEEELGTLCKSCWYKDNTECGAKKYKNKKKCRLWRDKDEEWTDKLSWGDRRETRRSNRGSSYYGQS